MGKDAQKIEQRIEELTERLNNNYDSKLISEIHYWESKLLIIQNGKPKRTPKMDSIIDYNYSFIN